MAAVNALESIPLTTEHKNRQIFLVYNLYRLALPIILLGTYLLGISGLVLGSYDRELFLQVCVFYLLLNFAAWVACLLPNLRVVQAPAFVNTVILTDIFMLVLVSYTCGGVSSGMAHLLVVPIAAGSILQQVRMSIFFAAVATIAIIYSEIYLYFTINQDSNYYVQAGLLGITLFATALAIQILGGRLRQNELIAERQAHHIQSLQEMNHRIIQRMRTGILVVDAGGHIVNANAAGLRLIRHTGAPEFEHVRLPETLRGQLEAWKSGGETRPAPFRLSRAEPQIQANFAYLNPDERSYVLIFLEDYSLVTSRLQQLKLVSLGRLTASIAHEVRNPLGAISHAAQLMGESPNLSAEDLRFTEIIIHQCDRVNAIIENILQLSRKRDEIPQVIGVREWLEQFVWKFTSSNSEPVNIALDVRDDAMQIRANPSQLEQLMTNLCDNGLRYSRRHRGRPELRIEAGLLPHSEARYIDVIDEGPGIERQDEEKIFEPFFTTESTGTGLGLYICREICEANQAQILFRRTSAGKSSFRLVFAHPDRLIM